MEKKSSSDRMEPWPALPLKEWEATRDTLQMWMQIVGKIRLALSPRVNHWWEVTFYLTARGLTTSPIPYQAITFEIEFDFIEHTLLIQTSAGGSKTIRLAPRSVADFHEELMSTLRSMDIAVQISTMPQEIPNPIRFEQDRVHSSYDPEYANRFWRVLVAADSVFKEFRGRFIGKCSPVHFFWGAMDLAVTRFSGRRAPERPGADAVMREGYSHEVISAGFWPGSGEMDATFYAYAAPEPAGFPKAPVLPSAAYYSTQLSEFLLPYDAVRKASSPREFLLDFMQTTYEAGAILAKWDRESLERTPS